MVARITKWVVAGALVASLVGCGQKGALYLPDKGGEVVTRPGGQTAQPAPQSPAPAPAPQPNSTDPDKKNQAPK